MKATANGNVTPLRDLEIIYKPESDAYAEAHMSSSLETPMTEGAFDLSDHEKIEKIQGHFKAIMETLGLDLSDESLAGTPRRVAKMYINEIFKGLKPENFPSISLFPNKFQYKKMLVERNITVYSYCEHHFVPIIGKAHVAYIPDQHVIGLSKINRIVEYFSKRPQVQERLTEQIAQALKDKLDIKDVAVIVDADHLCVASRGIQDVNSSTVTSHYSGEFLNTKTREEFLRYVYAD